MHACKTTKRGFRTPPPLDPPLKVRGLSKIGRLHGVRIACVKAGKVWYEFHVYISVPEWDRRGQR